MLVLLQKPWLDVVLQKNWTPKKLSLLMDPKFSWSLSLDQLLIFFLFIPESGIIYSCQYVQKTSFWCSWFCDGCCSSVDKSSSISWFQGSLFIDITIHCLREEFSDQFLGGLFFFIYWYHKPWYTWRIFWWISVQFYFNLFYFIYVLLGPRACICVFDSDCRSICIFSR